MKFPKTIKLTLTQAHMDKATCYLDTENCLLATAIREKPSFRDRKIWVGGNYAKISGRVYTIPWDNGCDPIQSLYRNNFKLPYSITLTKI